MTAITIACKEFPRLRERVPAHLADRILSELRREYPSLTFFTNSAAGPNNPSPAPANAGAQSSNQERAVSRETGGAPFGQAGGKPATSFESGATDRQPVIRGGEGDPARDLSGTGPTSAVRLTPTENEPAGRPVTPDPAGSPPLYPPPKEGGPLYIPDFLKIGDPLCTRKPPPRSVAPEHISGMPP